MDASVARLAVAVERHEAMVWDACFEAAAALPGNPLGAVIERSATPHRALLAAVDSDQINRVVGMGLGAVATEASVREVVGFFRSQGKSRFRVEHSPSARPPELVRWLEAEGLRRVEDTTTKMWCRTDETLPPSTEVQVHKLGMEHRDAIGELGVKAWGAWESSGPLAQWFGATVGRPGFHHYGVLDGQRLVSVGALAVSGPLGWLGFAASDPRYRGSGLRRIINLTRLSEARSLGCRIAHVEIETKYASSPKLLFSPLFERAAHASDAEGAGIQGH